MERLINAEKRCDNIRIIENYVGIEPFTVLVDDSPRLRQLAEKARELRSLPFQEKLKSVKKLALDAMVNAYEQMIVWERKARGLCNVLIIRSDGRIDNLDSEYETARSQHIRFRGIVSQEHPLSYALEQKAGCCRYQGALFFVLGYEADLGDQHFVHGAPVNSRVNTVFNEVIHNKQSYKISIFADSLEDKSLDYSVQNPRIFEQAFEQLPGCQFYSYHRRPSGLVIVESPNRHVKTLE